MSHERHLRSVLLTIVLAWLGAGCCAGGIDEMTIRLNLSEDITSRECNLDRIPWNDTLTAAQGTFRVIPNDSGRGPAEDWIQIFDASGTRVPITHIVTEEHECEGGCPADKHHYTLPPAGTYTAVHFQEDGVTTDDEDLVDRMGAPALVVTLVVE